MSPRILLASAGDPPALPLHTWGSALTHHPHVHVIVPGGGLSPDGSRWIACKPGFFLPVRVLSRLFRRLFLEGLAALHAGRSPRLPRRPRAARRQARLRRRTRAAAPLRLGRLRQEALRRTAGRPRLSRRATPTASPSRTPGSSRSTRRASPSNGRSYGEMDSGRRSGRVRLRNHPLWRRSCQPQPTAPKRRALSNPILLPFSSLWSSAARSGSLHHCRRALARRCRNIRTDGDVAALLARFSELKQKTFARTGKSFPIVAIHEAGLDGFWLHRVLEQEGIESHVVDPASIATSRRRRRPKTDRIDGEALLRALLAYKRGEPRVCAMVGRRRPRKKTAAASAASARC